LATNALKATQAANLASPLTIYLHANDAWLRVSVWDALRQPPGRHPHDLTADHGRGLQIVAARSHDWGTYRPAHGGKIVYALIPVASGTYAWFAARRMASQEPPAWPPGGMGRRGHRGKYPGFMPNNFRSVSRTRENAR